jgi:hypothetical protein
MNLFIHGFKTSKDGLLCYEGLNTIKNVEEVVLYNEKGKAVEVFETADCEALAIFAPTVLVLKKDNKYHWSNVRFAVEDAKTVDGLKNGKNYVKCKGVWMLLEEKD